MKVISNILETISEFSGRFFAWSTILLVLLICLDVILRYCFKFSFIWIIELEIYFFAMCFLLSSAYAFKHDKHVRVDLFYCNFSEKKKAWTNLLGGVFLLLPWSLISTYVCFAYFLKSWRLGEGSPQPGGLPGIYILKFILFLGFLLLVIQAFAEIIKALIKLQELKTQPLVDKKETI